MMTAASPRIAMVAPVHPACNFGLARSRHSHGQGTKRPNVCTACCIDHNARANDLAPFLWWACWSVSTGVDIWAALSGAGLTFWSRSQRPEVTSESDEFCVAKAGILLPLSGALIGVAGSDSGLSSWALTDQQSNGSSQSAECWQRQRMMPWKVHTI